jgi:hypothetical protein
MSPNNQHAARLRQLGDNWCNATTTAAAILAGAEALERQGRDLQAIKAADAALTEAMETISDLRGSLEVAKAALESIHKGTCLTAQESRSRDDDRYCLADVMNTARGALARLEGK